MGCRGVKSLRSGRKAAWLDECPRVAEVNPKYMLDPGLKNPSGAVDATLLTSNTSMRVRLLPSSCPLILPWRIPTPTWREHVKVDWRLCSGLAQTCCCVSIPYGVAQSDVRFARTPMGHCAVARCGPTKADERESVTDRLVNDFFTAGAGQPTRPVVTLLIRG